MIFIKTKSAIPGPMTINWEKVYNYILDVSNFPWHIVKIIHRYDHNVLSNKLSKFWLINETTLKVILVWNFGLRVVGPGW